MIGTGQGETEFSLVACSNPLFAQPDRYFIALRANLEVANHSFAASDLLVEIVADV